ncbi:MAG: methyltetrahydrofolate cobalamin methyltransferase, partial [Pseudomonadota bacterium]
PMKASPGREMEAVRAANFLANNDAHGADWIRFNKPPGEGGGERAGRRRRRG